MSAKQITKRCHWVPQVYLRAFAADAGRTKVWRLSKNGGEPELKRIEKVAVRFNLYVPRCDDGRRDDAFERKLADLEQWYDDPVWCALRDDFVDLSWEPLRMMVSLLAATMFLRHPNTFGLMKTMHARIVEECSGPAGLPSSVEVGGRVLEIDPVTWPAYRDSSEDEQKRIWFSEVQGAGHYAKIFMDMRWSVLYSNQPVFITTDNPVTFVHPSLNFHGIKDFETTIFFPVGPRRLLCFDHRHSEPANQYYPLKETAAPYNVLMWRYALDHMFSHRHPDLVCSEICKDA